MSNKHARPRPTWKAWTHPEGDREFVYVSMSHGSRCITISQILEGDLGAAIMLMIVQVRDQALRDGWLQVDERKPA